MDEASHNREAKKIIRTIERNKRVFNQTYVEMPVYEGQTKTMTITNDARFVEISTEKYLSGQTVISTKNDTTYCPSPLMKWPKVYVNYKDPIIMAYTLKTEANELPLIVYSGCNTNRGGGAKEGATTVEAELCRRTNYWKSLKKSSKFYPLRNGMAIHSNNVEVFKNSKCKLLDRSFHVDILSVILPQRPSKIVINDQDMYENSRDRDLVTKIIRGIANFGYNVLIFCNFGLDQPIDEFLALLNREIGISPVNKIYFTLPNGDITGLNESDQRTVYIKYCQELDNKSPPVSERADCEEPPRVQIIMPHREKRKKMLRTVIAEKKPDTSSKNDTDVPVDDLEDNSDDCKSIAQLDSSDED